MPSILFSVQIYLNHILLLFDIICLSGLFLILHSESLMNGLDGQAKFLTGGLK